MILKVIAAALLVGGMMIGVANGQEIMSAEEIAYKLTPKRGIQLDTVVGEPTVEQLENPARPHVDLGTITFEFNSTSLTATAMRQLDEVARALRMDALADTRFMVGGHTDNVGSESYNLALSEERANAVVNYLVRNAGIEIARLNAIGWGEQRLKDMANPDSAANRRVEISNLGRLN